MKTVNSLNEAIKLSISTKKQQQRSANFKIKVMNEYWNVHEVSICERDILCYCDKGSASFLVDSYGDKHLAELFDWEV
jgi:hypothetical protein